MRNQLFIGAAVAALVAPASVQAQEVTSVIRGSVTENGVPVAGAAVTVVHVPTGTRSSTTTDASGTFTFTGLRVGGPFTVTVNDGQAQVTDINTIINTPYDLPIELADFAQDIVVTAANVVRAGNISQGPATILTAEQISTIATINRDVRDLSRRDPFARLSDTPGGGRAISFAGQNPRFNRFTVDGVPITDNFGLNPDGLPTRRSPIPLDAIGQYQTRVAPFDVREGNFQGGVVNVVLKSGTNEFHGTGFYAYTSDELQGDRTKDLRVDLPNFRNQNYGAELSGPIIKDKLFFMVAGERIRDNSPVAEGPVDNNAGNPIPGLTQGTVDEVARIARDVYGYETGGVVNNQRDRDDRLVARLDANLSETQRAALTYAYTKDSIVFTNNTNQNAATPALGLASNAYTASQELHAAVFNLNSDWSDSFSTEFRAFYKDYVRGQTPLLDRNFAQFQVCTAAESDAATGTATADDLSTGCPAGVPTVSFGPDISRQSNRLTSNTWGALLQARLQAGDHDIRVFAEYQDTEIFNLFLQRTTGDYYFDSLADFRAGRAQRLRYQNAVPSLDPDNAAASFTYQTLTFGLQDNWRVTDTLNVSLGARFDLFGGDSRPERNQNFFNRFGFTNTAYINGRSLFQPRFGFDWKPLPRLALRGGVGIFGGGSPDVYISNSFSNPGNLANNIDIRQRNNGTFNVPGLSGDAANAVAQAALRNVNGAAIPAAVNNYLLNASVATTTFTNALDPNFNLPSQWRATLSADYDADLGPLGDGWRFGADFFYSAVRDQVLFTDLRVRPTGTTTPDGRPRYAPVTSFADTNFDILLTNTDRGRSYIGVVRFDKSWDFGLNIFGSYTYQDVKDQAPATSSVALSNYSNGAYLDPNIVAYGRSNDEVRHFFKYGLNFERAFFGDYKTRLNLFGETRTGRPYTFTFQNLGGRSSVFGTIGSNSRYLLYVPTGPNDPLVSYGDTVQRINGVNTVTQTAAEAQSRLDAFINSTGLSRFRGRVVPRNAFQSPWFTKIDLHVEQEIPAFFGNARFTVFADIENVGNLINRDWGQIREFAFPQTIPIVNVSCVQGPVPTGVAPGSPNPAGGTFPAATTNTSQPCGQYRYDNFREQRPIVFSRQSLYAIRVGARFTF
jgi:hypothetical protein